jgi:hypothetical protein
MQHWRACEQLLLRLMLLDRDSNGTSSTCSCHYGQSDEGVLLLLHRFFVLGAVCLLLLGAMYFMFMLLLNLIFMAKDLAHTLNEMLLDAGPAAAGGLYDFGRVMLHGLSEVWSICTRDNMQYLLSLAILYLFMPMILSLAESLGLELRNWKGSS